MMFEFNLDYFSQGNVATMQIYICSDIFGRNSKIVNDQTKLKELVDKDGKTHPIITKEKYICVVSQNCFCNVFCKRKNFFLFRAVAEVFTCLLVKIKANLFSGGIVVPQNHGN